MSSLSRRARSTLILFWVLAVATIPTWIAFDHVGWDLAVYASAIHALHAGHDPYVDTIAIDTAFHRTMALHPNAMLPFGYNYPPITLPLLRLIGALPIWLSATLYWLLYILSALSLVWVGVQFAQPTERRTVLYLAPAALFFPGLLNHDAILSGNVAFILYALILVAAVVAWRRGQWYWCYLAILLAACFKPPLLTLLAIPLLSGRRPWLSAGITAAIGIALFVVQPFLWPTLFHHFLQVLDLQFLYNRDFGCSPAGLVSNFLVNHGIPYSPAGTIVYLAYAIPLFALLLYLSRRYYLAARLSFQQWLPVMLLGAILLNPRIMQYDVVPLTLPMALIGWRFLARFNPSKSAVILLSLIFVAANAFAIQNLDTWKLAEGILLVLFFAAGCWNVLQPSPTPPTASISTVPVGRGFSPDIKGPNKMGLSPRW